MVKVAYMEHIMGNGLWDKINRVEKGGGVQEKGVP